MRSVPKRCVVSRDGYVRAERAESDLNARADADERELHEDAVSRELDGYCLMVSPDCILVPKDEAPDPLSAALERPYLGCEEERELRGA
jgi:hypothetical protein